MDHVLAIIPARGGSKAIPGKNLAPVGGRPLIAWTVDAARQAQCIDRIIVSTDDPAIARTAGSLGAEVPFVRPAFLAADDTPGLDPVIHALLWLAEHEDYHPAWVACLQPTSPLRTAADIDAAFDLATGRRADAVVSVVEAPVHPHWALRLDDEGRIHLPGGAPPAQRQALEPAWALNGAVYLARTNWLLDHRTWYGRHTYALAMPEDRSLDVDTPWQLRLADLCLWQGQRRRLGTAS